MNRIWETLKAHGEREMLKMQPKKILQSLRAEGAAPRGPFPKVPWQGHYLVSPHPMIPSRVPCSFSPPDCLTDSAFAVAKSMERKADILFMLEESGFSAHHAKLWHLYVDR